MTEQATERNPNQKERVMDDIRQLITDIEREYEQLDDASTKDQIEATKLENVLEYLIAHSYKQGRPAERVSNRLGFMFRFQVNEALDELFRRVEALETL